MREKSWLSADEPITVSELKGGVSSVVLKIVAPDKRWVLKQALPRLRVEQEWLSSVERIGREQECLIYLSERLTYLSRILRRNLIPKIIHRDPENHLYIMSCASDDAENWRDRLLAGHADAVTAASVGSLLGQIHSFSHADEKAARQFGDKRFFHELRLDPF